MTVKENKNIKQGDKVIVIAGNDRGTIGEVLNRTDKRVVVQGVNLRKKHSKQSRMNQQMGIITIEMPVHISNVRICVDEKKPIKLHKRKDENGNKELYYKQGSKTTTFRSLKKNKQ